MRIKIVFLLLVLVLISGCSMEIQKIKDNPDDYLGETVMLTGTVSNTIKLGALSGFTLNQKDAKIIVSSEVLPEEGSKVTVKGVVMKELLIGVYIQAKSVN